MERREMVRWLVATAGLKCLDGLAPDALLAFGADVHQQQGQTRFRVLDAHARRTVIAAAERILPASDTPGATDANVVAFIDRMLADWYSTTERDALLAGLRTLDARCRSLRGRDFAACSESDQVAVLSTFDDEVTALRRNQQAAVANEHWFAMLKYLTVFGYCTSEPGMTQTLRSWPKPGRYDGCAPVVPRRAVRGAGT